MRGIKQKDGCLKTEGIFETKLPVFSYETKDINGLHIIYACLDSNANKPFYKPKGFEII